MITSKTLKLYWVEDDNLLLSSVNEYLKQSDFDFVMTCFSDGEKLIDAVEGDLPDMVVLDINLPKLDGLSVGKLLKTKYPDLKIVISSFYNQYGYVSKALTIPVDGYMVKGETSAAQFKSAILRVYSGHSYYSDSVKDKVIEAIKQQHRQTGNGDTKLYSLSPTEKKILIYLANGMTADEIGIRLQISKHTVVAFKKNMFKKLEATNATQLVIKAMEEGLISMNMILKSRF